MKKVISVILTLLMLISTSSIGYGQHFCGNYLAKTSISLEHSDLHCGMEMQQPICEEGKASAMISRDSCCKDHISKIETDKNYNGYHLELEINDVFFVAFTMTFINAFFEEESKTYQYIDYKPPLPDKDVLVLYQTFLI